jgi:hypothetical protein
VIKKPGGAFEPCGRGDSARVGEGTHPRGASHHQKLFVIDRAIAFLVEHRKKALVVTQPYLAAGHKEQQEQLRAMLTARFGGNANVAYANLGESIDMIHSPLTYDGMHLTPRGNAVIARDLVDPVVGLMPDAFAAASGAAGRRGIN